MYFDIEEYIKLMSDLYQFDNTAFLALSPGGSFSADDELNEAELEFLSAAAAENYKKWIDK